MGRHHGAYLPDIWQGLDSSSIVSHFKIWLGSDENTNSLFIVDDLDALMTDEAIDRALPRSASQVIFSTRDPTIGESLSEDCKIVPVGPMEEEDTIKLLKTVTTRYDNDEQSRIPDDSWTHIARTINGHPLAAWHTVSYIMSRLPSTSSKSPADLFADMFEGRECNLREQFLDYHTRFRPSIQKSFGVSKERLRDDAGMSIMMLELIALISSPDNPVNVGSFLKMKRPWLGKIPSGKLPNQFNLTETASHYLECISILERVSFGTRGRDREYFDMHPLWRDCLLHRMGKRNRSVWLRALLFLCHESWIRDEPIEQIEPVVRNLLRTCERFGLNPEELPFAERVTDWIKAMKTRSNEPFQHQARTVTEVGSDSDDIFLRLRDDCDQISQSIRQDQSRDLSRRDLSKSKDGLNALLANLEYAERLVKGLTRGRDSLTVHLDVYEKLLSIAPLFKDEHPGLIVDLKERSEKLREDF